MTHQPPKYNPLFLVNRTLTTITMDFSQTKLSKMEWESIETPVSDQEKQILRLIRDGYYDLNIKYNDNPSLLSHMKMEYSPEIESYLYEKYFAPVIADMLSSAVAPPPSSDGAPKPSQKVSKRGSGSGSGRFRHPLFAHFQPTLPNIAKFKPPKKIDLMRLKNMDNGLSNGTLDTTRIFEFIQLSFCQQIVGAHAKDHHDYPFYVYTLLHMKKSVISHLNAYVVAFVQQVLDHVQTCGHDHLIRYTFQHAHTIIEKNPHLLRFENRTLYDHQKQLFQLFRQPPATEASAPPPPPKLVLYTAPTGTGKTMSPLALSEGYRVIYICAARHIGLALARSAISMEKRVAFAFGCETAADIRLHYYSAAEYTKNYKTGGIFKVDNSNGCRVEIMICDIRSYCTAMHYMLAFNDADNLVLYWDEPTIALDVPEHELHAIIRHNWRENKIANVVLACATLPNENEIADFLTDYRSRFNGGTVHRISSTDCKKSISLLNPDGYTMVPHLLFASHADLQRSVTQCETHPSLLRYLDLREIVRMVQHAEAVPGAIPTEFHVHHYFPSVDSITMNNIKAYYVSMLKIMSPEVYPGIHEYLKTTHRPMFVYPSGGGPGGLVDTAGGKLARHASVDQNRSVRDVRGGSDTGAHLVRSVSDAPLHAAFPKNPLQGVLLTTCDAHTLTDGPTIYIVEDVARMSRFYAQHSHIPQQILEGILTKIEQNNLIQKRMDVLMKSLDDMLGKEVEKERKMNNDVMKPEAKRLMKTIESIRGDIQILSIGAKYTPNTRPHQQTWIGDVARFVENAFVPSVDDTSILKIMELGVDTQMKLLLLMGIGVFDSAIVHSRDPAVAAYLEVVKRLTSQQKLFLIVASSDYIYGTNYQLCHCFLGKDLENMTQQKIIQAMGRVGRNNIQQEYTIRFRDEALITRLFLPVASNMEAVNMCKLMGVSG